MKTLSIIMCLTLLAAFAALSAAMAEPVKHAIPQPTNPECVAAQEQARKSPGGQPRVVYSACQTAISFSRHASGALKNPGVPR